MHTNTSNITAANEHHFVEYERLREEMDEITDAAERIILPVRSTFDYTMESDGDLYFQDESIVQVLRRGVENADLIAQSQPQFMREYVHRCIELDEYNAQRELALRDGDHDILVVMSPAVAEIGKTHTMVRIYQRTAEGIRATSLSFERSDTESLRAIACCFVDSSMKRCQISDDVSAEDILAMRCWGSSEWFDGDVRDVLGRIYDTTLASLYGGDWSGGRPGIRTIDAQTFILAQPDLLSEHLAEIRHIKAAAGYDRDERLENARYEFAAQLNRRIRNQADASSRGDAAAEARARGDENRNNCPTGRVSASHMLDQMGFLSWKQGSCRVCLQNGMVGACSVCSLCEKRDNLGHDLSMIHRTALARAAIVKANHPMIEPRPKVVKKPSLVERVINPDYIHKPRTVIGGQVIDIIDRSGTVIQTINA